MNREKIIKYVIPILLAIVVVLGFIQRGQDPYVRTQNLNPEQQQREFRQFLQKGKDLAAPQTQNLTATFLAVGDIMLSRNVAGSIQKANDPLLPFKNMEEILKSTDFNFGNLESPISGKDHFNPTGSLVFNAPVAYAVGLKEYNFDILTLANNHALDQGASGLEYTTKFLDEQNIKHVGVGKTLEEAWRPEIVTANGIKIGFIGASYSSINDNGKLTNNYVARIEDIENLKLKIENLKSAADFIVVTMHAGTEYVTNPNQKQIDFAHAAIDFGADLVIGHHAHWVQTIEKYNNKYIFYGLGNFIFDQEWSRETKEGLTLKIQVSKNQVPNLQGPKVPAKLDSIELIPVIIENYSTPRPATFEESQKILQRIGQVGTFIK